MVWDGTAYMIQMGKRLGNFKVTIMRLNLILLIECSFGVVKYYFPFYGQFSLSLTYWLLAYFGYFFILFPRLYFYLYHSVFVAQICMGTINAEGNIKKNLINCKNNMAKKYFNHLPREFYDEDFLIFLFLIFYFLI